MSVERFDLELNFIENSFPNTHHQNMLEKYDLELNFDNSFTNTEIDKILIDLEPVIIDTINNLPGNELIDLEFKIKEKPHYIDNSLIKFDIELKYDKSIQEINQNDLIEIEISKYINNIIQKENKKEIEEKIDIELNYNNIQDLISNDLKYDIELNFKDNLIENFSDKILIDLEIKNIDSNIDLPKISNTSNITTFSEETVTIKPTNIIPPDLIYETVTKDDLDSINSLLQIDNSKKILINKILKDWYSREEMLFYRLINIKNLKWVCISINNIFMEVEKMNFPEYLKTFYITDAYLYNDNEYIDLMDSTNFNNYFNNAQTFYNSLIDNYNIINKLNYESDSCWIKKESPKITALIVGINYSNNPFYILNGPENDADNMEETLNSFYGNDINIIKMTEYMTDKNFIPTLTNIERELENLIEKSSTENIIFYFAGHIQKNVDINNDEIDGKDEEMLVLDGIISDDWFYANFIKKLNSNCKCRIYIDSCFSEGFLDLKYKYLNDGNKIERTDILDTNLAKVISITSSKENQESHNVNISGQYEGLFTNNFTNKINSIGNFDIKLGFKIIDNNNSNIKQNIIICSTHEFNKEPILLL